MSPATAELHAVEGDCGCLSYRQPSVLNWKRSMPGAAGGNL